MCSFRNMFESKMKDKSQKCQKLNSVKKFNCVLIRYKVYLQFQWWGKWIDPFMFNENLKTSFKRNNNRGKTDLTKVIVERREPDDQIIVVWVLVDRMIQNKSNHHSTGSIFYRNSKLTKKKNICKAKKAQKDPLVKFYNQIYNHKIGRFSSSLPSLQTPSYSNNRRLKIL